MAIVARFNDKSGFLDEQLLELQGRLISPIVKIGNDRRDEFKRFNETTFIHHILDQKTNEVIDPIGYDNAKYEIRDYYGMLKLRLTLNEGVSILDKAYVVSIPGDKLKFSGHYIHQFHVMNEGKTLATTFYRELFVI